ncbi:MAG: helix-turn-helix transcriptional regulator [Nitrospirota bacterium]
MLRSTMYLPQRKVDALFALVRDMHATPPWKDPERFFTSLHRVIPFDYTVPFMKLDADTARIIPSTLTFTNGGRDDAAVFRDHNGYFYRYKHALIASAPRRKCFSLHFPATPQIQLPEAKFREYHNDFWHKHRMAFSCGGYFDTPGGRFALYLSRSAQRSDFSAEEKHFLDLLLPHLQLLATSAEQDLPALFVDAKGTMVSREGGTGSPGGTASRLETRIKEFLPNWITEVRDRPLAVLRREFREAGTSHALTFSQIGFGRTPLFRVSWTAQDATPVPAAVLRAFAHQHHLSPREADVLACAVAGKSMKEIAVQLGLAVDTIKEYLGSLYRKTDVDGRGPLVAKVLAVLATPGTAEESPSPGPRF